MDLVKYPCYIYASYLFVQKCWRANIITNLPCTLSSPGIVVIGTESVMFGLLHLILSSSLLLLSVSSKGSAADTRGSPSPSSTLSASSSRSSSPSLSDVSAPSAGYRKIYNMLLPPMVLCYFWFNTQTSQIEFNHCK